MNLLTRLFKRAEVPATPAPRRLRRSLLAGARSTKLLMDWITSAISIDKTVRAGAAKSRARARELALNNPFARQYLSLLQSNVIGPKGMKLQSQVRSPDGTLDKAINDAIEAAFTKWARRASADGRLTLTQVAHLAVKTLATDGEVFIELVTAPHNKSWFSLHVLDTDLVDHEFNRVRGVGPKGEVVNEIRMGVEIDEYARPVRFHVRTYHHSEAAGPGVTSARRVIEADKMLHIFDPERADQTRGITWFNSVMTTLHHLEKYSEAELVAARIASGKMGFLKYTDAAAIHLAQENGAEDTIPNSPVHYDASPGSIEMLPPGVEFQEWSPSHPNTGYDTYSKALLRETASGLQVSYHSLANDLTGVNYSSIRAGVLSERDTFRRDQQLFIDQFYLPIYEAWLANALLAGAVKLPTRDVSRYTDCTFIARGWPWVDPLKDVNSSILMVQHGFASKSQICAETGLDFEEILEQRKQEIEMEKAAGLNPPAPAGAPAKAQQPTADDEEEALAEES